MRKYYIYGIIGLLLLFPFYVDAEAAFKEEVSFNYGGNKDDLFSDLDFFSDGSYVAVGTSKSSFRDITNSTDYTHGIIAIFDKNNNIILEKSFEDNFYGTVLDTQLGSTKNELMEVEVIDSDSFITCGLNNTEIPYCIKYKKDGTEVWRRNLTNYDGTTGGIGLTSSNDKKDWDILKTSDNGFLVSFGNIGNSVNEGKIIKLDSAGNIVFTTSETPTVSSMIELSDKYIVTSADKIRFFELDKTNGDVLNTKLYVDSSIGAIYDINKIDDGFLLSIHNGQSNDVFGQEFNGGVLAKIGTDFNVVKVEDLDVVHNMESIVLSDGKIVTVADKATTPTSGIVYLHDEELNLLAYYKYESDNYFSISDVKVNPINGNIYFVGDTNGNLGNHDNLGGKDAVVVSLSYVLNAKSDASLDSDVSNNVTSSDTTTIGATNQTIDNPKTGSVYVIFVGLLFVSMVAIFMTEKANKIRS